MDGVVDRCPTIQKIVSQDMPGTLILICGLPGAGKTTLAKQMAENRRAIRMCPDDWIEAILDRPDNTTERDRLRDPVENLQWDLTKEYLGKGLTVILENGFWAEEERTQYACEALELGASIELHYVAISTLEEMWERVQNRNQQLTNKTFVMTRDEVESAWSLFQSPTEEELSFYDG